jgi:hypothetical protein
VGQKELIAEIASTDEEKSRGLMGRKHLPEDQGMLFMYLTSVKPQFWMKDTLIPLSVAFIDHTNTIIEIRDMEPLSEARVSSRAPVRFALEVNQGWFEKNNIRPGDRFFFKK